MTSEKTKYSREDAHKWLDDMIDQGGVVGITVHHELNGQIEPTTLVQSKSDVDKLEGWVRDGEWYGPGEAPPGFEK